MEITINYRRIGRHIRAARKQRGMTQAMAAEKLAIHENSYGNMERGSQPLSLQRIIQCCVLYGVEPGEMLNDCCEELVTLAHPLPVVYNIEKEELLCLVDKCSEQTLHSLSVVAKALYQDADGLKRR